MAQKQQSDEWHFSQDQIRMMSEAELRDALAKQQVWTQQRFPNDAPKPGQPEQKPQDKVPIPGITDPYLTKLREFAGWSPQHLQNVQRNDLPKLVAFNAAVIDRVARYDAEHPTQVSPAAPVAKQEQPELGKVDGAGGPEATKEYLTKTSKKEEPSAKVGKAEETKSESMRGNPKQREEENTQRNAAKKTDTAAAPGAMTPKDIAKTKADFAAESKAAETRLTQAGLHILGNNYQVDDGKPHGRGYDAVDGIDGPGTRAARANFVAGIQDRNPSVKLDSPADVDAQIRAELVARKDDPVFNQTLAEMRQSGTPQEKKIAGEIATFYQGNPPMPEGRQAVIGSGITRTVERYQQPAPVEKAATPAAPAPGQESAFEEPAFGFNDQGATLRQTKVAFSQAAQGQTLRPSPENQTQPTESALGQRAYDVVDALTGAPSVTDEKTQEFFAQAYNRKVDQGLIRNGDPVLFEGDPNGRLFVAVGQEDRNKVGVVEVAPDSKVVSDMKALAAANKGVYIDRDTIQNAQKQLSVDAAKDRRAANIVEALQRDPDDITRTNLGQTLARSYRNDIAENRIRPGEPVLFEGDRKGRLFVAYGGQDGGNVTVKDITNFNDPGLGLNPLARDIASLAAEGRGGMVDNTTVPNAYAAAMDRARQWQEQREQQRQQQLAQQQEWAQRQQQSYSSAPPPSGWYGGSRGYEGVDSGPPPGWHGSNPGVSFRGDRGPPPGWPGGGDAGISFRGWDRHGSHHHGHEERRFSLDNPGGLLRSIFGGASSGQPGDSGPVGVIADLLDNTSARWTTGHGHNRFNLN